MEPFDRIIEDAIVGMSSNATDLAIAVSSGQSVKDRREWGKKAREEGGKEERGQEK
jgi:hypothetical protein